MLRHAGLIESVRGRAGGYRLAAGAKTTGLGDVLKALGEPLFEEPTYCERHAGTEVDGNCVHLGACSLRGLWNTLEQWIRHSLDQITLADLLSNERDVADLLQQRLNSAAAIAPAGLVTLTTLSRS